MSDVKPNAQEDKDVDSASESRGHTQEPLQSHTLCLTNNAAGPSSEEHENPLNGTQPNPFVYSRVPAVPHAGNSLPSGALVNGPGSHPASEVHCVLNKGTVLSNNVLDAAWQAEKDTRPEVLPPPSELQSDAWKNTAGSAVKTLAAQPGVNTPLSHLEENESKLACSTLSGDGAEQTHISKPWTKQTIETGCARGVERPRSSADDCADAEVIRWDSTREGFLHSGRRQETRVMHQREKQHNTHVKSASDSPEKVNNSLNHTDRRSCSSNDVENVDIANKDDSSDTQSGIKYSVVPFKDLSKNTASDSERGVYSVAQEGCNEGNDPEDEDGFSQKVEQPKTERLEPDPSFFSCTICNVNFKEKRNFHRHMMYHLGKHNQVNSENHSQAFICRECGRLFCDRNSLMRHIIIHQDRLEKLMEEIKGLKNTEFEGRVSAVSCPRCVFGCNCPKIFVQHATTHDNLKHYYFCEECNFITLTQQALELHLHVAHLDPHQPQCRKVTHTNDAEEADHVRVQCKMGFLETRSELENHRSQCKTFAHSPKIAACELFKSGFGESARFSRCSSGKQDICIQKSADKNVNSPQVKCHVGCAKNTASPSLWRISKHGKLLLQPVGKLDVATDLTCVEEDDAERNGHKAFGSSEQANCPATADILLSARNLKLDQMFCERSKNNLENRSFPNKQANQKSPSMRTVSTPLCNTIDEMNGSILPRLSQRRTKHCAGRELEKGCEGGQNFSDDTSEAAGGFLESSENERNPYARRYFKKRPRFSAKDKSPRILEDEEDGDEDCSDIEQLIIKEELIETAVCDSSPESPRTDKSDRCDVFASQAVEHKPCPYCPAVFESGVGLSNHVRGHLHRVGLSYNARHMVSPEQVALRDHRPRTRRRIPTGMKKLRKAVKSETHGEHTCPLCWGWFDTRTGLSNHVRGHLKRMGRGVSSTSKSPLCILSELLQDQKEHENILRLLDKGHTLPRPSASQRVGGGGGGGGSGGGGLVLMSTTLPVKIQYEVKRQQTTEGRFAPKPEAQTFSEKNELKAEAQRGIKASSSTLVELLKMRRGGTGLMARSSQEARAARRFYREETQTTSGEPNWTQGESGSGEFCVELNRPFPAAVRLCGHLQDCAGRKRIAVFEESGYDYKQKKPRPRPGLKKKTQPSGNAQIYTLTCRFCDLVFQGPLSIQEDWIRHLQRHLLHTSVPPSGTRMVEVLGFCPQNTNKHV